MALLQGFAGHTGPCRNPNLVLGVTVSNENASQLVSSTIESLANLLEECVPKARLNSVRGGRRERTIEEYMDVITSHEERRSGQYREVRMRNEIHLPHGSHRDRLSGFIYREFGAFISEKMIAIPSELTGDEEASEVEVEVLIDKVVELAVVWDPKQAARAVYEALQTPVCKVQDFFVIAGLRTEEVMEIYQGIRIVPPWESALPPYVPTWVSPAFPDDRPSQLSIVIVDLSVGPRFAVPPGRPVVDRLTRLDQAMDPAIDISDEFNHNLFCDALALSLGQDVRLRRWWRYVPHKEIANVRNWGSRTVEEWPVRRHGMDSGPIRPGPGRSVQAEQFRRARQREDADAPALRKMDSVTEVYEALKSFDKAEWKRLRVAIDRWRASMEPKQFVDRVIDLGIALESLYVRGEGNEISYRLSLRGAWHLGGSVEERREIFEQLKGIYGLRSDAVHEGKSAGSRRRKVGSVQMTDEEIVALAREHCRNGILKVIGSGFPDWKGLVLGGGGGPGPPE